VALLRVRGYIEDTWLYWVYVAILGVREYAGGTWLY